MTMTQNGSLARDDNDSPVAGGVSSVDLTTIVNARINPITGRLLVQTNAAGGTGTWYKVNGTINGSNVTFTISITVTSDFFLTLARQPQIQDIGADTWDYSYTTGGGVTTITYHTPPDASLSGQPHAAFVIS